MIIQLRGTSGSGKSTLVRRVMQEYPAVQTYRVPDRRRPIGYVLRRGDLRPVAIPGHYETDCGGCDTINGHDQIFDLVRRSHEEGHHVLFEGLLISHEFKRSSQMMLDGLPFLVIGLEVPVETCEQNVRNRRAQKAARKGKEPRPFGPNFEKNIAAKYRAMHQSLERLDRFCDEHKTTRHTALMGWDEALQHVLDSFGVHEE